MDIISRKNLISEMLTGYVIDFAVLVWHSPSLWAPIKYILWEILPLNASSALKFSLFSFAFRTMSAFLNLVVTKSALTGVGSNAFSK